MEHAKDYASKHGSASGLCDCCDATGSLHVTWDVDGTLHEDTIDAGAISCVC